MSMQWYQYPINVPYGNPNFDKGLGGSHDLDVQTPIGTTVTFLEPGKISSIDTTGSSAVPWGEEVTEQLNTPINGHDFLTYLHLGQVAPDLSVNEIVTSGTILGLSGGASNTSQNINGFFLDTPYQSSGPQTGLALGDTSNWGVNGYPNISSSYDPTGLISKALDSNIIPTNTSGNSSTGGMCLGPNNTLCVDTSGLQSWATQAGIVVAGAIVVIVAIILVFK